MTDKQKAKLETLIEIGLALEANDYNSKFEGYPGFEKETRSRERRNLRRRAVRAWKWLENEGINPRELESEDEELEYALQFI